MELKFWQVDAFVEPPLLGNPAAVVFLDDSIDDDLMQKISTKINLSDTAFVQLRSNQNPLIRWFTPQKEIALCGHATLASAHVYFSMIDRKTKKVSFDTLHSGPLSVFKNQASLTMSFPLIPGNEVSLSKIPDSVLKALSSKMPTCAVQATMLMLVYEDEEIITNMTPDFAALAKYKDTIIVTAKSSKANYDFVSRFFAMPHGTKEDPVTGSAHCILAPYWGNRLKKNDLVALQASQRGGRLELELGENRLNITGKASIASSGSVIVNKSISIIIE
ncbi:MAG: putative isomerase YddE [Chlamydiia bacterium]|nr:putative isomerase YddE [Chlamydiia bacterium]